MGAGKEKDAASPRIYGRMSVYPILYPQKIGRTSVRAGPQIRGSTSCQIFRHPRPHPRLALPVPIGARQKPCRNFGMKLVQTILPFLFFFYLSSTCRTFGNRLLYSCRCWLCECETGNIARRKQTARHKGFHHGEEHEQGREG